MVLNVDDWVETTNGDICLVVNTSKVRRAGGRVALYSPGDDEPHEVDVDHIKGCFPAVRKRKRCRQP